MDRVYGLEGGGRASIIMQIFRLLLPAMGRFVN